jgi:putative FmdB family regulatory protein
LDAGNGFIISSRLPMRLLYGIYKWGGHARSHVTRKEGTKMPTYSFQCKKCSKKFEEILSFREHAQGKRKCPKCGSRSIAQLLEGFFAKTSKKS